MPSAIRKVYVEETEDELMMMTRAEATRDLTDREQSFCEHYCRSFNIIMSAIKAGYSKDSAHIVGYKIRRKYLVNRYICWLKLKATREHCIAAADIIDQYIRIGFADITDFVQIANGRLKLRDGVDMDGQIVTKIKQGRDGITFELADKLSALDKLERYFDVMPKDWRQQVEERKVALLEQRIEIERFKAGQSEEGTDDDGFIEALKETAESIWDD